MLIYEAVTLRKTRFFRFLYEARAFARGAPPEGQIATVYEREIAGDRATKGMIVAALNREQLGTRRLLYEWRWIEGRRVKFYGADG